jgi:hypothetical protein
LDWQGNFQNKVLESFPSDKWDTVKKHFWEAEPHAVEDFDYTNLDGPPVIAADDVALYAHSLPTGGRMEDVVASMAPPFDKFFIEFQRVPNRAFKDLNAWGVFIDSIDKPEMMSENEQSYQKPRWELQIYTFLEKMKGLPFGPVAMHFVGLADDGTWFRIENGELWSAGGPIQLTKDPPEEIVQDWADSIGQLIFPSLLTLSFLHCKNVKISNITPPKKLSRKHQKKRGRELVRYHILDIDPMRKLLERYRTGSQLSFRQALHICRGHFKTFTSDAPLLGRHTGTYWWAPHIRGAKSAGVILKDYRVNAPSDLGKVYREADEDPPYSQKEAPSPKDPDSAGRGLAAHNRTQNKIADIIRKLGLIPKSPKAGEPDFDIAWKVNDTLFVCEVKSITRINEEKQLRMAIGQVIRYRQKLNSIGYEPVRAVIAAEREPTDTSWDELFINEDIVFVWPDVAKNRFNKEFEIIKDH